MDKKKFDLQNEHLHKNDSNKNAVLSKIRRLLLSEDFAILCTKDEKAAYGSLVAFYISDDLKHLIFATPDYTNKYKLLNYCQQVSIVVDDRAKHQNKISNISAITMHGQATQVTGKDNIDNAKAKLLDKHGYLDELTASDSCVFFNVEIKRCLYVTHIQEVYEWVPDWNI